VKNNEPVRIEDWGVWWVGSLKKAYKKAPAARRGNSQRQPSCLPRIHELKLNAKANCEKQIATRLLGSLEVGKFGSGTFEKTNHP